MSSRKGFSLIEVMMVLGIVSLISLGITHMIGQMNRSNHRTNVVANAQMIRSNFVEMLNNGQAWSNTLADLDNSSFQCLRTLADCRPMETADANRTFQVRDPSGAIFYSPLQPQAGLTENGAPCSSFPSSACPFRVFLTWRAFCPPTGACWLPQMEVAGGVLYQTPDPSRKIAYNPANYSFKLIRTPSVMAPMPSPTPGSSPVPWPSSSPAPGASPAPSGVGAVMSLLGTMAGNSAAGNANPAQTQTQMQQMMNSLCTALGPELRNPQGFGQLSEQFGKLGYPPEMLDSLKTHCTSAQ